MVSVRANGLGLGFGFRFRGSEFKIRVQPIVHVMQTRNCYLLASPETITTHVHTGGTELFQMSWSTDQDIYSKLVV